MNVDRRALLRGALAAVAMHAPGAAHVHAASAPKVGQKGKDVAWVPSEPPMIEKMLDLAGVTAQDYVIDLGSGDGRVVIAAARRGARALGVEYDAELVAIARRAAAAAGVADRVTFTQGDMYAADLSRATVLALFLLPYNLMQLAPKFAELKPGTRIVTNTYEIGVGWEPQRSERLDPCATRWCVAHLYVVPR